MIKNGQISLLLLILMKVLIKEKMIRMIKITEEKDDSDERNYDKKEAECPVSTPSVDMEEGVGKKNVDKNDRIDEETSESEKKDSISTIVNDAEGTDLTLSVDIEEGFGK